MKYLPNWIINILGKFNTIKIKPTGKHFNMWDHKGWGNTIRFLDWDTRKITGHTPFKLSVGDELRCKMDSGKIAVFLIEKIKYENNPPDMFFGEVKDVGYLTEN